MIWQVIFFYETWYLKGKKEGTCLKGYKPNNVSWTHDQLETELEEMFLAMLQTREQLKVFLYFYHLQKQNGNKLMETNNT